MNPIFLKPIFQERIWGGTALRDVFGYDIPSKETGECWAIFAHSNGPSIVENGPYVGKTLTDLWREHQDLFDHRQGKVFPLLTKVLDANQDLSIQVHPDDLYAKEHENGELGKTECWYVIDCKENAEIVYGHTVKTKGAFVQMIENGQWNDLLRRVKIKPGDFFYVPSGTIHALCEGTLILETQQSSDTTYRVYDYDRKDVNGNKRELHLKKAIDATMIPHVDAVSKPLIEEKENVTITTFVQANFFTVYKWNVKGKATFTMDKPFMLCSVIDGLGTLIQDGEKYSLKKGRHFLLPAQTGSFEIEGACELIVSHI
ncbi:mannose-6-phosphate isomerase, class I [Peribacillus muralis]|uniref:mannose-6-phosphate isomerase, class I n=1 Tax=Peribacillus muralis TaxID=264697 RepID=UPI00070F3765|nr:mannose-6-phosphate isomerase, class I [Peribacillus muralis]